MKEKILDLLSLSTYKPLSVDELYKTLELKTSSEYYSERISRDFTRA